MAVNIRCPNLKCRMILKVPTSSRGKRVRCSFCGKILMVPSGNKSHNLTRVSAPPEKETEDS